MDAAVLEAIAARLEFRGTDEGYARRSQAYFPRLPLPHARRILASAAAPVWKRAPSGA
jgi:hypothetical protein